MAYLTWALACIFVIWILSKSEKRHQKNKNWSTDE